MPRTIAVPRIRAAKKNEDSGAPLSPEAFARAVSKLLVPIGDPALRPWMKAYLKNQYEFLGIKTPVRRAFTAKVIRRQKGAIAADLLRSARLLWECPEREYQYVAIDLLGRHVRALNTRQIPALFRLVKKKSWWDTTDSFAAGVIGPIVRNARLKSPDIQRVMDKALQSPNMWVRRTAILHQLGWRNETDSQRLFGYAIACGQEKEFFVRKAIGWALRDYARHAPGEVLAFLRANRDGLSTLTVREAAKHI
jgi:3-methyladenine DNA glycosylase AlkD